MSLNYDFYDIASQPQLIDQVFEAGATEPEFPKVRITSWHEELSVSCKSGCQHATANAVCSRCPWRYFILGLGGNSDQGLRCRIYR